ncbi:TPA: tRNA (adenosine(37)-N6)-dimethylallyltransferase MiaA [Streptococcus suis]|nr:tRNA (adenosine(37)-N6)-dimethylallyltransferase MiaA [Streptococcus suis]NQO40274.1 tRNA (adenosine(37)-N6)-dimethylallyltransferase MiaA [Streptococcus suis]NQP22469.1 tRNA (adenosine(37)-N6)-dimethylallyltransferase MiaA [Streptococcus suis]NQP24436.1 tRNA (adenosine(37)-N6)-dimethylallyltransferase MiaA [Streptococcus suis]HEL1738256.1 tRNA (adenosine(37)-N6)-dimethylallyltransferase MiaA [Streptococcus suis]
MKTKVIVVIGPTAVGKTALGIDLAQRYNGEIISGDSQQVYRKLDIGTAKASPEEQAAAVHHLIDVRDVTEGYSAYEFVAEAKALIADITSRGKLPVIVGGTGLYIQSLLEGYHLGGLVDQEQVLAYRAELDCFSDEDLETMAEQAGLMVEGNSRRRIIRGLELKKFGKNLENTESEYVPLYICLTDDRQVLYDRINQRVDKMMAAGLLEEVSWLYKAHPQAQAAMGIGYKEFFPYLAGAISLEEAIDKVKQNSRRFAKRQLTWFRNRMAVDFYQVSEEAVKDRIYTAVEEFLDD